MLPLQTHQTGLILSSEQVNQRLHSYVSCFFNITHEFDIQIILTMDFQSIVLLCKSIQSNFISNKISQDECKFFVDVLHKQKIYLKNFLFQYSLFLPCKYIRYLEPGLSHRGNIVSTYCHVCARSLCWLTVV